MIIKASFNIYTFFDFLKCENYACRHGLEHRDKRIYVNMLARSSLNEKLYFIITGSFPRMFPPRCFTSSSVCTLDCQPTRSDPATQPEFLGISSPRSTTTSTCFCSKGM